MSVPSFVFRSAGRIAAAGVLAAVLAGAAATALISSRFGGTEQETLVRVHDELSSRVAAASATLASTVARVSAARPLIATARQDNVSARILFDLLEDAVRGPDSIVTAGVSIVDDTGAPIAWAGRVTDLPADRLDGPSATFSVIDPLGPRLVRVEPILDPASSSAPRIGTVIVEQVVAAAADPAATLTDPFVVRTSLADVRLRAERTATGASAFVFPLDGPDGQFLLQAEVDAGSLQRTRQRWTMAARAIVLGILALTVLICAGPVLEWRRHARQPGDVLLGTGILLVLLFAARGLVWVASTPITGGGFTSPLALAPTALLAAAIVWLLIDLAARRRFTRPPLMPANDARSAWLVPASQLAQGMVAVLILAGYLRGLGIMARGSSIDLLHFSLHPLEPQRLALAFALLLMHASVIWVVALVLSSGSLWRRLTRDPAARRIRILTLTAGLALGVLVANRVLESGLMAPLLAAIAGAIAALGLLRARNGPLRRASQTARLAALFLALLLPAFVMYPALQWFANTSKEQLVSEVLAPLAASQREDLLGLRLPHALQTIDATPNLAALVTASDDDAAPTTDRAFLLWSQTELATYWTTSAVELYGARGQLVSRFSLIPEYGSSTSQPESCTQWELYEETSPFGASARNILRATRAICERERRIGAVVVRAMLDYRALPFVHQQSPYIDSIRSVSLLPSESNAGRDIEFAVYGWSRTPIFSSGPSVWPLPDSVFEDLTESRQRIWTQVVRDDSTFRVYFFSDRAGIYALGYPVVSWQGHLINLGELTVLAGVLYLMLMAGATLYGAITSQTLAGGRALLREIRSSFYRKLFLAFVASAVIPVVVLAVGVRTYFSNQFRAGIEDAAIKTATVAQRLIEDYATLLRRGSGSLDLIDDQFMVLVRRAIDQDVNLFERDRLQATSERPLFASRLLPARTPARVYRAIVLDRLPTTVGIEDVGGVPYLLAAAPVRTAGRAGIVTVPQPLRGQEVEQQRDELDRRVLSAAVLFVLLGAAIGYWMAERIADPVNRLTRATRRIARGDLDARVAATSSDELRRLVENFNRMAEDLKRQRADLERSQRLEAWADMARQVAHDIKNPLTPIQLSAEHARRVNIDRGRPLSPVLDECVSAILSQVRLLRQISAEFSSFASSPTARPESVDLPALVNEVVGPYRTALESRVPIDVRAEEELPPAFVDRTLFARALTNIVENALHAMPSGGSLAIRCFLTREGSEPRIGVAVTDTGLGMDADALSRVFEPYFSTRATGTGLGLTIAKRNIELNGGTIAVQSAAGVGTTVTFLLPVTPEDRRNASAAS